MGLSPAVLAAGLRLQARIGWLSGRRLCQAALPMLLSLLVFELLKVSDLALSHILRPTIVILEQLHQFFVFVQA